MTASRARPGVRRALVALLLGALAGCQPDESLARMIHQRRVEPYAPSTLFADGAALRQPPDGTVPTRSPAARAAPEPAPLAGRALLERGRDRFSVICAACHGLDGRARTVVAGRMKLRPPPSLLEERIRALPLERIAGTIASGAGLMPGFAAELPPDDRRAVAAWVRVLELAGGTRLDELPPAVRAEAEAALGERAP